MKKATRKGKLIVIDGIDGSGKATQTALLVSRLRREGFPVKTIDFPRYYDNFFGRLIGEYLSGRYGNFIRTDPRLASVLYAADRFESNAKIRRWLEQGNIVIADRYVSANQIHQGGKIKNAKRRAEFMRWLGQMEYGVFGIPKPDLVIYLDVPYGVSRNWLRQKITQRKKGYTKGRVDVAEANLRHLKLARQCALSLARQNLNWERVVCCPAGSKTCLSVELVSRAVWETVRKRLRL